MPSIIELIVYFERLRIVRKPRRVFDVIHVMAEPLQPDDVMDVLPDYARNGHRAHEAHHDNFLASHFETTKSTKVTKNYRDKSSNSIFARFVILVVLRFVSPLPLDFPPPRRWAVHFL